MEDFLLSIVVPVYNRPDEIEELLASLVGQKPFCYEVIIVEDGSAIPCKEVVERYEGAFPVQYIAIPNGGPSNARNVGSSQAQGRYLVILDSDVVLPPDYIKNVVAAINYYDDIGKPLDAFGGPDAAHEHFSNVQKAINYSMTSFLTTGGIRGGKRRVSHYFPRSFNLGCRRALYQEVHGFDTGMRFGEDLDFSMRLHECGAHVRLLEDAKVYHKRRVDFRKFFRQVFNSGIARIHLSKRHPNSLRLIHLLPSIATLGIVALFLLGLILLPLLGAWATLAWLPIVLLALLFFVDALLKTHSFTIALLAIRASFTQVIGYGSGLLIAAWRCVVLRRPEFSAFNQTFYK